MSVLLPLKWIRVGRSPVAASVVGLAVGVLLLLWVFCYCWGAVYPL